MFYVVLSLFAAAIVAVDQWTKALAAAQLTDVVDVLIPGWLELRYLLNDGMALSMFRGGRWVFVALTVVFFAFVVWIIAKKHLTKKPELWCLAAITGGAIGNLIDRIRTGALAAVERFNREIKRQSMVRTEVIPREGGDFSVVLGLDDEKSNLMTIELMAPTQTQGRALARAFSRRAEKIFQLVMTELLDEVEGRNNEKL